MKHGTGRRAKWLWVVGGLWLLAPLGAAVIWCGASYRLADGATGSVMRGKAIARRLGCFACHGPDGAGGVSDPAAPGGDIPGWVSGTVEMYVTCDNDIREWILYGQVRSKKGEEGTEARRHGGTKGDIGALAEAKGLAPMPAYEDVVTAPELDDLVAYFKAASGFYPDMPDEAYEGWKLASRLGCFGCHGPSGLGGVPNPGSFKGHIPPWDGEEFDELVRDDAELREWILEGKTRRLWTKPGARFYLERQKIQMPAYGEHLSDDELNKLVDFVRWLQDRGA